MLPETKIILHETANLWLRANLDICLNAGTHSVVVGKAKDLAQAKWFMAKIENGMESGLRNLKAMYGVL